VRACSAVTSEDGERRAVEEGVLFLETSAKAGHNIKALFRKLATALPGSTAAGGAGGAGGTPAESNLIDIKLQPVPPPPGQGAVSGGCSC
jgi:Ras-related protein Rab-6A